MNEEALELIAHANADITIFTDGSAYEGGVGAAAILTKAWRCPRQMQLHLGKTDKYTIYTGEVVGLLLGAHLLKTETSHFESVVFAVDNQATILSLHAHKPAPSHLLLDDFEKQIKTLRETHERLDENHLGPRTQRDTR